MIFGLIQSHTGQLHEVRHGTRQWSVRAAIRCQPCHSSNDNKGFSAQNDVPLQSSKDYYDVQRSDREVDEEKATPSQQANRDTIVFTCLSTSGVIGLVGLALHAVSPYIAPAAHQNASLFQSMYLDSLFGHVGKAECGLMLGTAGVVTAIRVVLLQNWSEFEEATNVANRQILLPIKDSLSDIAIVAVVPAIAEEILFRWALVPAVYPDWRGAVVSGLVFGVLHTNGGRNSAFAAWASCVGCAYAFLYLYSGSVAMAVGAHSLANILSASLWLQRYDGYEDDPIKENE